MADITIYEESDVYIVALLQSSEAGGPFAPEINPDQVDFEVFNPDGVSLGVKGLGSGVENVGMVTVDGVAWGKFRAKYHFPDPGVYSAVVKATGQEGGKISGSDDIPVERL